MSLIACSAPVALVISAAKSVCSCDTSPSVVEISVAKSLCSVEMSPSLVVTLASSAFSAAVALAASVAVAVTVAVVVVAAAAARVVVVGRACSNVFARDPSWRQPSVAMNRVQRELHVQPLQIAPCSVQQQLHAQL